MTKADTVADIVTTILEATRDEMSPAQVREYARGHSVGVELDDWWFGQMLADITSDEDKWWYICRPVRRVRRGLYKYDSTALHQHYGQTSPDTGVRRGMHARKR